MVNVIKKYMPILAIFSLLTFSNIIYLQSASAAPATYTVNVTSDEIDANIGDGICETANAGECTLRAAIEEANSNSDIDTIEFNIAGSGAHVIQPTSDLPEIYEQTIVDGYTNNSGATPNSAISPAPINSVINIGIDMSNADAGLIVSGDNSTVKGLSIYSCSTCLTTTGTSPIVQGNFLGLDNTGLSIGSRLSHVGLLIDGNANEAIIGGVNPADRNLIVGSENSSEGGLFIRNVSQVVVKGNYLGIGVDGETDFGIKKGIFILNSQSISVGGASQGGKNVISGATEQQVNVVFGNDVAIQGNYIGVDSTGNVNSSINNGTGAGFQIGTSNSIFGGTNPSEGNLVAGISGLGISITSATSSVFGGLAQVSNNAILGNEIHDISTFDYPAFGDSNQGIDLLHYEGDQYGSPISFESQGVTENDPSGDSDIGPNGNINFPVLTSAVQVGNKLTTTFDLDAADSTDGNYRIEFFANDSSTIFGHGPGQIFLGSTLVQNGNNKQAVLTLPNGLDISGRSLSSTTTAINNTTSSGFGATSEFAQNILVGSASDFDSDTIPDAIENGSPNNGDGNNDGIADSIQPTVTSFVSATSGDYTTFVTSGCSSNGYVTSIAESSLDTTDTGFQYPYGLTDFVLNCSRGDIVTIDKYIFTPQSELTDLSIRKYRPATHSFEAIPNSNVVSENIGGEHVLHLNYSIQDGQSLDDDGLENGIIVDPMGLAQVYVASQNVTSPVVPIVNNPGSTSANGTLASTGANPYYIANSSLTILMFGLVLLIITKSVNKKQI
ncbi:MAG: hypothetical protein KBF89_07685 [Acidimicrobiia bacterium]|nr:hypothetical protein [Acidimicrobiia bacterium]